MAKEFFKEHGITYQEVDVTKDQVALKDMANRSGQMGVPVIDIDGQIVVGFDQERLTELLGVGA
jgi:glutaredoxin